MEQYSETGERPAPEGVPTLNAPFGSKWEDLNPWLAQGLCKCGAPEVYADFGDEPRCAPCGLEWEMVAP